MPDIDAFELRFAAAYRRYLDEVDAEVDAVAVARSVAGGARQRRGIPGLQLRWAPARAWVLLLVALLTIALAGAYLTGMRLPVLPVAPTASPPASPSASAPAGLHGTWNLGALAVLAVHPCAPGERCGRFELVNDSGEQCVYTLEYRPRDGDDYVFLTAEANTFSCAWSALYQNDLHVRPQPSGTVLLSLGHRSWELSSRSAAFEPQLPPTIAGEWSSVGGQEQLRLNLCGPDGWCGSLTLVRGAAECGYGLQYRPPTYEEYVFWIASASGSPCDTSGWLESSLVVRPVAAGELLITHAPGAEFPVYKPGYEPGSANP